MPVIRIIPGKESPERLGRYIRGESKTDGGCLFASGCDPYSPEWDFKMQSGLFHKNRSGARKYYHIIISYNTALQKIPPGEMVEMTQELCRSTVIRNYPYFGAVHYKDRPDHVHCHLVVSNVACRTDRELHVREGGSFRSTGKLRRQLMDRANEICREHGYGRSLVLPESRAGHRLCQAEVALLVKGELPWKERLRICIDTSLEHTSSVREFRDYMYRNYHVMVQENRWGEYR